MKKVSASEVVFKFASKEFWSRYSKLLVSMNLQEAKVTLGFPPNSDPTPEAITKAYRMKALEHHRILKPTQSYLGR
jgi:hypothetical protein